MFESIISSSTVTAIPVKEMAICIGIAMILGAVLSLVYIATSKGKGFSKNFAVTLVLIPAITALVIMLIGSDIAKAISLGGVFALVRFRSVPGDSKDISSVFFAMAVGLACGMGFVSMAVVATVAIGIVYAALVLILFSGNREVERELKITIPEDLNYADAFTEVFEKYLKSTELVKIKTVNLGTLYQLTYHIKEKSDILEKEFLDELRCRNGNLNIILGMIPEKEML